MNGFQTGLDRILSEPLSILAERPFGLLFNQASLSANGRYACDELSLRYPDRMVALFSPQHGIWGEEQANMIETGHGRYEPLRLPLFSLYSETRQPTREMLADVETLVIDLQDVGTRVYTFAWTMVRSMEACAAMGKRVVILDRPNPIGGHSIEGPLLQSEFRSFVGLAEIPMRHGLTLAELAKFCVRRLALDIDLVIVPMLCWHRKHRFPETGRSWTLPSPNMPTYRTTCVYPGGVLLEGTNLSEGRGTTIPFELVGAPFVDGSRLADTLNGRGLPGVRFRPTRFRPTFDKWCGESCQGVLIDVIDETQFESYRTTLHILHAIHADHPRGFAWLPPPYEYETIKPPIDILSGSSLLREAIDANCDLDQLNHLSKTEEKWRSSVQEFLLYT